MKTEVYASMILNTKNEEKTLGMRRIVKASSCVPQY